MAGAAAGFAGGVVVGVVVAIGAGLAAVCCSFAFSGDDDGGVAAGAVRMRGRHGCRSRACEETQSVSTGDGTLLGVGSVGVLGGQNVGMTWKQLCAGDI